MNVYRSTQWGVKIAPNHWIGYLEAARNGEVYAWSVEGPTLKSLGEMEKDARKMFKAALNDPDWIRKAQEEAA